MTFSNYRLPDGRIVAINDDVARGEPVIDFTLKDGAIVKAERVTEDAAPLLCQETTGMIGNMYIRCRRPAVMVIQHRGRDEGPYPMCHPCGDHNARNRNADLVPLSETLIASMRSRQAGQ